MSVYEVLMNQTFIDQLLIEYAPRQLTGTIIRIPETPVSDIPHTKEVYAQGQKTFYPV